MRSGRRCNARKLPQGVAPGTRGHPRGLEAPAAGGLAAACALTLVVAGCTPADRGDGGVDGEGSTAGRSAPRLVASAEAAAPDTCSVWSEFRGLLGENSPKIRRAGGRVSIWAGGDPSGPGAEWYDFTGAPIDPAELQYGIGRDRIRSIDIPLFVPPDDPRLLDIPPSPYRRCERPQSADEIMVIGYVAGGTARAYPTALLDHHEVVNDAANGKPFTVGW